MSLAAAIWRGTLRMVRTLEVTSSPVVPSPRVRPLESAALTLGSSGVLQGEREAVELELANVAGRLGGGFGALQASGDAVGPGAELGLVVGVVEREHRARVGDLGEALFRLATHALGGGVGREEAGVLGFEGLEAVHGLVVLGIGPLGGVEHVVEVLVVAEVFAESLDLLFGGQGFGGGWSVARHRFAV